VSSRIGFNLGHPTVDDAIAANMVLRSPTLITLNPNTLGPGGTNLQQFPWGAGWPDLPGKLFVPVAARLHVADQSGTHVANPTLQSGTNVTLNNFISGNGLAAATINTSIGQGTTKNNFYTYNASPTAFPLPPLNGTGPDIFVGTQSTAGTTLSGYLEALGYLTDAIP
jgi:hypothetical protein